MNIAKLIKGIVIKWSSTERLWGIREKAVNGNWIGKIVCTIRWKRILHQYGAYIGRNASFDGTPCFPHGFYGVFISGGGENW